MFSPSAKGRLTRRDLGRYPGASLRDRIGRAVCEAGCLPRKEFYESWEVARRVRRLFRGGRVVDLASGHGLLAHMLLLLDDSSPAAVAVDTTFAASGPKIQEAIVRTWPRLDGRVQFVESSIDRVALSPDDLVVSIHACGALTDRVLDRAATARARVAVLPCCHDARTCDTGSLEGWVDPALAIDLVRAEKLKSRGYRVWTQVIPAEITPKNRLLIGEPT